jgi:hypothetical protein
VTKFNRTISTIDNQDLNVTAQRASCVVRRTGKSNLTHIQSPTLSNYIDLRLVTIDKMSEKTSSITESTVGIEPYKCHSQFESGSTTQSPPS